MLMDGFEEKKIAVWSKEEALLNMQKYCAFQERCHQEVRTKLLEHKVYGDALEEIITELIIQNFLDEERFAKTFARGKFRMKQWGRNKIKSELKLKQVSAYSIKEAMTEINDDDYLQTLQHIIAKKERLSHFKNQFDRVKKLTDYALGKGYEYEIIASVLNNERD